MLADGKHRTRLSGGILVTEQPSKYRFLLINAFSLAPGSAFQLRSFTGPKESQIYNYPDVAPFLAGKTVKKVIYVPGRILNLVVEG